jgi:CBS domain containing-hemolysin-like protein
MSDDSLERNSAADPLKREASPARDSWMDRLKLALGLKGVGSIRDDLEEALEEAESGVDDEFSVEERRILRNLLAARDVRVQDVMVPRGAIIGISQDANFAELRALFGSAGHSRLPVYAETLDDPKGMIHIRDMFARLDAVAGNTKISETSLLRPVLFAPGTMPALDLLLDMQRKHIHMALVIDEYGATDGLVSLEDLLEIIVGEIEDEHDVLDDPNIERLADGSIAIDARAGVDDVARMMQVPFAPPSDEHDIESIGGYVTALIGRVPAVGEAIAAPNGLVFTVMEGDQRRLKRVRIAAIPPAEAAEA